MSKATTTIPPVPLTAGELAELAAIAAAAGCSVPHQVQQIIREWIGPQRVPQERQRRDAAHRLAILTHWWDARRGGAALGFREHQVTAQFLLRMKGRKRAPALSRRTLYNWERRFQSNGLAALVDGRREPRTPLRPQDDPFIQELEKLYRATRRPLLSVCYREVCRMARLKGWPVKSYRAACRLLAVRKRLRKGIKRA
jgi:hypothetical protein